MYNTDKESLDKKIEDVQKIPNVKHLNTKIGEIEDKIPNHDVYITTSEFNRLTAENFAARSNQVNYASKNDIADLVSQIKENMS